MICRYVHKPKEMFILATSDTEETVLPYAIFCFDCWVSANYQLLENEVCQMAKDQSTSNGKPEVKGLQDTRLVRLEWDATHSDLKDKNIILHSATCVRTQYGDAYVCVVEVEDQTLSVLMGGTVLVEQISTILEDLPVACRVEKPTRYFLLVESTE